MKALIFGANGQDGYYLSKFLSERGIESVGVSRSAGDIKLDVGLYAPVRDLIQRMQPDLIFHLAANSTTSPGSAFENHETISTGCLNILDATWKFAQAARVFIAGSALQFQNRGEPIAEDQEFAATSLYAVARIQATFAARYYRSLGLKTYVGYLFHHESPLRRDTYISQKVAQAAARIKQGADTMLEIGDVTIEREWTFAGDTVRAIYELIVQDKFFEAVIGSGTTHSIQEWIEMCFGSTGLDWRAHVRATPGFKAEYRRLKSCPTRLNSLGWKPAVDFAELAQMMTRSCLS